MTVADGGARAVMANYAAAIEHVVVRDGGVRRDIDFPSDLHG
jgi:CTP:molybdopterin cytidylyltransferase MocA